MTDRNQNDDFWDLSEYKHKNHRFSNTAKAFTSQRTSAIEINDNKSYNTDKNRLDPRDTMITTFIPPHSDANLAKKNILFEYEPQNPLIKKVTVYSDCKCNELFVSDNLFIRERRALLDRATTFKEYVPFYSYSPRYSQLNKAQLNWYIWWRQNARNGNFIKTDESYVMLYAYELAATGDGEDKEAALRMLCSLLTEFSTVELGVVYKIMIRDIICDFCLINKLPSPVKKISGIERQVLLGSFLPEFFIDFSQDNDDCAPILTSMSLYDYRRSKYYNEENEAVYKRGIDGAITATIKNDDAFNSITSFTRGVYGGVTEERHPFTRMANVVNKNVKIEIIYYELTNIRSAITDMVRYSENKVREHLGIRNKIHVLTINPLAKAAIDSFFDEHLPARQFVDRRRKDASVPLEEPHKYDKLYDLPKAEISPERALEIERESWDTTKKLTEAFADGDNNVTDTYADNSQRITTSINSISIPPDNTDAKDFIGGDTSANSQDTQGLYAQLYENIGTITQFVNLCKVPNLIEQKKFAMSHNSTVDEIADKINEAAAELFGDIILENDGNAYVIIEDYLFLFN